MLSDVTNTKHAYTTKTAQIYQYLILGLLLLQLLLLRKGKCRHGARTINGACFVSSQATFRHNKHKTRRVLVSGRTHTYDKGKEDSPKSYRCRPRPDKKKSSKSFHNDLRYPSQRETDRHLISRSVGNACFVLMLRGILLLVCVFRATVNTTAVPCCATTPQEARRGVHLPHLRR